MLFGKVQRRYDVGSYLVILLIGWPLFMSLSKHRNKRIQTVQGEIVLNGFVLVVNF